MTVTTILLSTFSGVASAGVAGLLSTDVDLQCEFGTIQEGIDACSSDVLLIDPGDYFEALLVTDDLGNGSCDIRPSAPGTSCALPGGGGVTLFPSPDGRRPLTILGQGSAINLR